MINLFCIKKFLLFVFLIFIISNQSLTKADDISDFEIEGMSLGESLLKFFDQDEIKRIYVYPNKEFATTAGVGKNFQIYDGFQAFYYDNDKNYKIHYLAGKIMYRNNDVQKCYKKMAEIVGDLKQSLSSTIINEEAERAHDADKTGKSRTTQTFFNFPDGSEISVACNDWSKEMQADGTHADNLAVALRSSEFAEWLNSGKAYRNSN